VSLVNKARLPAIYPEREYADDGGLMVYGANVPDNFRRAAEYVDRILKGAKPGDLPIQEPVAFDFVVNLKTARELDLTLPPAILARATEVSNDAATPRHPCARCAVARAPMGLCTASPSENPAGRHPHSGGQR
jgi:hypothetical protein